jgi:hypothetical protein
MSDEVDDLFDILESEDETSATFANTLAKLENIARDGSAEAAEGIAEVFAFSRTHRDPEKSYFWYHVALANQGYLTAFQNLHDTLEQYCGPMGDFRNESQVNGLVGELGEFRVRQLDVQASEWLRKHRVV